MNRVQDRKIPANTLDDKAKLAAFANNANDIAKTYAGIGDKMKAFPGAKSIMGKGTP